MLFGSVSRLLPWFLPVRSTFATERSCTPLDCAPAFFFASSTSAGDCSAVGAAWQAASKAVMRAIQAARIATSVLSDERAPGRLAHVAASVRHALLDASVHRDRRKHPAAAVDRGKQDHAAVGCEAGGFVLVAVG